ncbi:MAG: EF-hand domain-containing protein [Candidatus Sphingomonas phytovorans]|nr:EF-hand domain-containing protein [Sphingomonas sp.]WEJ99885.1 MAG: EF-hand domain-containing protein [Sphingomonas sp.]
MRKYLLAIALVSTAIGGAAMADQMGAGQPQRADTDRDGTISRAEFMARAEQRFAKLDANGDGQLSGDELGGRGGGRLMAADTNKDGKISKAEYMAQAAERFARLDANGDGKISPDEMKATMERMREGRGGFGGRPGGGDGPGMAPPPGAGRPMGGHGGMIARLDTNKDGKISREEMRASADARFDKLDTNKDGFIDQAEIDAARALRKDHMGKMRGHGRHGMTPPPGAAAPTPDAGQ